MVDNIFRPVLLVLVVTLAIVAAAEIVRSDLDPQLAAATAIENPGPRGVKVGRPAHGKHESPSPATTPHWSAT